MAFLFDTNAISEIFRKRPNREFIAWLQGLPRSEQYTSTIVVGELLTGAHRSATPLVWLERYEDHVLPRLTLLSFDLECARTYGRLRSDLMAAGRPIGEPDTLIAASAIRFGLTLVTANAKHFRDLPGLSVKLFRPGGVAVE